MNAKTFLTWLSISLASLSSLPGPLMAQLSTADEVAVMRKVGDYLAGRLTGSVVVDPRIVCDISESCQVDAHGLTYRTGHDREAVIVAAMIGPRARVAPGSTAYECSGAVGCRLMAADHVLAFGPFVAEEGGTVRIRVFSRSRSENHVGGANFGHRDMTLVMAKNHAGQWQVHREELVRIS